MRKSTLRSRFADIVCLLFIAAFVNFLDLAFVLKIEMPYPGMR